MTIETSHFAPNAMAVAVLVTGMAMLALGVATVVREHASRVSLSFLGLTATVGYWLAAMSMLYSSNHEELAELWGRVSYGGIPLIAAAVYVFTLTLLGLQQKHRLRIIFVTVVAIFFAILMPATPWFIHGVYEYSWGFYTRLTALSLVYVLFFAAVLIVSLAHLISALRQSREERQRRRVRAFTIALIVGYLGCFDYLPSFGVPIYPFGYVAIAGFLVLAARAEWRYRLIDFTPEFAAEQILETIEGAVFVTDIEGRVRMVNRGARILMHASEEQLLDRPIQELIEAFPASGAQDTAGEGQVRNRALRVRTSDGEERDVAVSVSSLRDQRENLVGQVVVAIDITALRREQRIAEERRLAVIRAEEALHAKDELIATIAHELRSPITAILGWTQFLRSGNEEMDTARESIEKAARTQHQLIEDLIDMSRITRGILEINRTRIDLASTAREVVEMMRPVAFEGGISLLLHADGPVWIDADEKRIRQVILNLMSNALKFTRSGGSIDVSIEIDDRITSIRIRDTGVGIDAEVLPVIFERYRRGAPGSPGEGTGLGLGLAIVKHLVDLHGGTVHAASEGPGRGATFTVALPLKESRGPDERI